MEFPSRAIGYERFEPFRPMTVNAGEEIEPCPLPAAPAKRPLKETLSFPPMPSSFASGIPETSAARSRSLPEISSVTAGVAPSVTPPFAERDPPPNFALKSSIFMSFIVPESAAERSVAVIPATEIFGEEALRTSDGASRAPLSATEPSSVPARGTPSPPAAARNARSAFAMVTVRSRFPFSPAFAGNATAPAAETEPAPLLAPAERIVIFCPDFFSFSARSERPMPSAAADAAEMFRSISAFSSAFGSPTSDVVAFRFLKETLSRRPRLPEESVRSIFGAAGLPVITAFAVTAPLIFNWAMSG